MPARNSTKQYLENGYYHLYNRGVEKRNIFLDSQDYAVFLSYLKQYLTPKDEKELYKKLADENISYKDREKILKELRLNNFCDEITLLAYCLMPNHFHFFVKQRGIGSIDSFMQSLCTRYSMFFNKKYKRVGSLYQGVYKAVLIVNDEQFIHLSRYIHKQALASQGETREAQPSSYLSYTGQVNAKWVSPEEVLAYFSKTTPSATYQSFVEHKEDFNMIQDLLLETEI